MKSEETLYAVLEVPEDASSQQVERAYRIARQTYQPGALAAYSLLADDEAAEILRRVEEAFSILSDTRQRREYDARLQREAALRAAAAPAASETAPLAQGAAPARPAPPHRDPVPPLWRDHGVDDAAVDLDEPLEPKDGVYDGPVLRRIRLSRGIELEEISAMTKVNEAHLLRIEANQYQGLPPLVYLRGYLRDYARCLNLDAKLVSDSYLARKRERESPA